jgi:hypothetical protein
MNDKHIFPYRIPDIHFRPHRIIKPFYAKVVYTIVNGKPNIEEIAFSDSCLDYITGTSIMMNDIRKKLDKVVANSHVDETILSALMPHI